MPGPFLVYRCNVENAALAPRSAERTALLKAVGGSHRDDWTTIAIAGRGGDYCWPCGSCRQMLYEFAPGLRVLAARGDGDFQDAALEELLPHGFGPRSLEEQIARGSGPNLLKRRTGSASVDRRPEGAPVVYSVGNDARAQME